MERLLKDSRVLVTGGAGFIGSNLVESLLLSGNYVVCLDNFSTGKRENITGFLDNPDFRLIEGDIRNYDVCLKAVSDVDYVFHQAALGSVPRSIKDPVSSTDVNIGGFVKILFASKEAGIKRFCRSQSVVVDRIGSKKEVYWYPHSKNGADMMLRAIDQLYKVD